MRHAMRHLEASVLNALEDALGELGWSDTAGPYGAGPLTLSTTLTGVSGTDPNRVPIVGTASPVVGVAILGQDPDTEIEVGGPGFEARYDLVVTVLAEPSLAAALGEDVKDILDSRVGPPVIAFVDQATNEVVDGETLEVEDVSLSRAQLDRADWLVLQGTVVRTASRSWA